MTDRDGKERIGAFRESEGFHIVRVVAQMTDETVEDDRAEAEIGGFQVDMFSDDAGVEFLQVIKGRLRLADENKRRSGIAGVWEEQRIGVAPWVCRPLIGSESFA